MDVDSYFDDYFPPGYRFKPYDPELVVCYLQKKVNNEPLPQNRIKEVELYKFNPETLTERYKPLCDKEWYFFTPRDRKYKNGKRPNRAAADGYWKATGADKSVQYNDAVVGFKKTLVFYRGKPPKGDKTNWIMHEFRVNTPPRVRGSGDDMRLDDWVLCRIYKKKEKDRSRRSSTGPDDDSLQDDQESESEYHDNGVTDVAPENYMPQDPGFINMSGYVNQGRFFNPYDDNAFMYTQSAFHNHIGRLPEGIPQYNSNYNPGPNSVWLPRPSSTWVQQPFSASYQNLDLAESSEAAAAAASGATSQPVESTMKLEQIKEYHLADQYWDVP